MSELTYIRNGDYLIPNLTLDSVQQPLGKYGRMRKKFLREHRSILWNSLILSGKLQDHLLEIDRTAQYRLERMMEARKKAADLTEQMKAENPMEWVGQMNSLKAQVEEILLNELIYS